MKPRAVQPDSVLEESKVSLESLTHKIVSLERLTYKIVRLERLTYVGVGDLENQDTKGAS